MEDNVERLPQMTEVDCAACGSVWTHQIAVEVYNRTEDDPKCETHVIPHMNNEFALTPVNSDGYGNPSIRRHGLRVVLLCESCRGITSLTLSQHKGQTLMEREIINRGPVGESNPPVLTRKTDDQTHHAAGRDQDGGRQAPRSDCGST